MASKLLAFNEPYPVRLRFQLVAFSIVRTIVNTAHRMVYPFLPAIARGLGLDLQTVTLAVTARSSLGLLGPLVGSFADLKGRKIAMLTGLSLFTAGMALVAIWPTFPALIAALILTGLCKMTFDPAMHAYVGDRVPYKQRGLAVGITEFGWSGAFMIGMPIAGWLIGQYHWNTPFIWLFLTGLGATFVVWRIVPADVPHTVSRPTFISGMKLVLTNRSALAAMGIVFLINGSSEIVSIIYGEWMENAFTLQVAALGLASIVIGVAELGGEGLVAAIVDRLGKRRSVGYGLALYALSCFALPLLGQTIFGALTGLFLFFITFEFTIVANIPLVTQLVPSARATMMSSTVSAVALGRTLGSLIGPQLFLHGIQANAMFSAACNLLALGLLVMFIREGSDTDAADH